jgi:hypothetical protein
MSHRRLNTIALPGTDDTVVLYDGVEPGKYSVRNVENLIREDAQGQVVWSAKLPQEGPADFFTDIRLDGDKLAGSTFSCWIVSVDIATGSVTRVAFHK